MRKILAVFLLLCCTAVAANDVDERKVLAARLVDMMDLKTSLAAAADSCIPSAEQLSKRVTEAYRKRPGDFQGISPQSAYWPEVEQAWRDYYVLDCAEVPTAYPVDIVANIYAARLTVAELREAIAFQNTAAARAMLASTKEVCKEIQSYYSKSRSTAPRKASVAFHDAMRLLKAKYLAEPK